MHPADIKASLEKKGKRPAWIAEKLCVHPSSVTQVIRGQASSRRIATYIADVVGVPAHVLWPDRYHAPSPRRARKRAA